MAGIIDNSANTFKRVEQAITRVLNAGDGYRLYIDSSTPTTIADVVTASGVVTLPAAYVPGRFNLQVVVNGLIRSNVGASLVTNDYVELNNTQIQFGNDILAVLTANQPTSNIEIRWNRYWPGVRDAELNNLQNVSSDIEAAILDLGVNRAAPADGANVLATLADVTAGSSSLLSLQVQTGASVGGQTNFAGLPVPASTKYILGATGVTSNPGVAGSNTGFFILDVAGNNVQGMYQNGASPLSFPVVFSNAANSAPTVCNESGSVLNIQGFTGAGGLMTYSVGPAVGNQGAHVTGFFG